MNKISQVPSNFQKMFLKATKIFLKLSECTFTEEEIYICMTLDIFFNLPDFFFLVLDPLPSINIIMDDVYHACTFVLCFPPFFEDLGSAVSILPLQYF